MSERPLFLPAEPESSAQLEPDGKPKWDERRMTLIEHLTELRRVLIVCMIAWGVASVIGLALSHLLVQLLARPLDAVHAKPVVLTLTGAFTIHLKVGLVTGFILALPVILQQTWSFVAPGLKPAERRFAGPLLGSSLALFSLGALLAYAFTYVGIRLAIAFNNFSGITYIPELNAYLGLVVILMLAFGIAFEFPVALVLLAMMGLMSSARLRRIRRQAYFIIIAIGYLITPGVDPITPLPLIIPLLLLYEASILVIRRLGK